jgi:hypothetical protein
MINLVVDSMHDRILLKRLNIQVFESESGALSIPETEVGFFEGMHQGNEPASVAFVSDPCKLR